MCNPVTKLEKSVLYKNTAELLHRWYKPVKLVVTRTQLATSFYKVSMIIWHDHQSQILKGIKRQALATRTLLVDQPRFPAEQKAFFRWSTNFRMTRSIWEMDWPCKQCDQIIGIKISPNMFDVTQNVPIHCSNNQKMIVYQNSPKVTKYLGDFKRKICQREISKIAQSGRTACK